MNRKYSIGLAILLLASFISSALWEHYQMISNQAAINQAFEKALSDPKNIESLDLSDRGLTGVLPELVLFVNVKFLDLSNNRLTAIPKEIFYMPKLRYLNLNGNNIKKLPKELIGLRRLVYLELNDNDLKTLPEAISTLKDLAVLRLKNNRLKTLPEGLSQLQKLENIELAGNQFTKFPPELSDLKRLNRLDLSNNQLTEIKHFPQLPQLETLLLQKNGLTALSREMDKYRFPKLKVLDLSHNAIQLVMEHNRGEIILSNYPYYLPNQLQSLNLSHNPNLKDIEPFITDNFHAELLAIYHINTLKTLKASNVGLYRIPEAINDLKELQTLDLSHNKLKSTDVLINSRFNQLETLNLAHNDLKKFKFSFQNLKRLQVNHNQIKNFSLDCPNLRQLNISNNKLPFINAKVNLRQLDSLDVTANYLAKPLRLPTIQYLKQDN